MLNHLASHASEVLCASMLDSTWKCLSLDMCQLLLNSNVTKQLTASQFRMEATNDELGVMDIVTAILAILRYRRRLLHGTQTWQGYFLPSVLCAVNARPGHYNAICG